MATYDYRCRECDSRFEVRRSVTDDETAPRCPHGHDDVARVWTAVGVVGARAGAASAPAPASASAGGATGGCCGGGCCS